MLNFDDTKKASIVNNLGIIAGIRASENSVKVLTSVLDTISEVGTESVKVETLIAVKVLIDGKSISLTEKQSW